MLVTILAPSNWESRHNFIVVTGLTYGKQYSQSGLKKKISNISVVYFCKFLWFVHPLLGLVRKCEVFTGTRV